MWNPALCKVTKSHDIIWTNDIAMLPEVQMSVFEISNDTIASVKLEVAAKQEPGGVDPVHDKMDLESDIDDIDNDNLLDLKSQS